MSAGNRAIWFNRMHQDTVYVDVRREMHPTVVCDTKSLPFIGQVFDLVVFDPPHMCHGHGTSMAMTYGEFTPPEIRSTIKESSAEAFRVSTDAAFMAFKWNDHDVKLDRMLSLMEGWEPLFGHKTSVNNTRKTSTYWVLLRKRPAGYQPHAAIQKVLQMIQEAGR